MSDDKAQQEPSMEDILASIRRILSEDEGQQPGGAPVDKAAPPPEAPRHWLYRTAVRMTSANPVTVTEKALSLGPALAMGRRKAKGTARMTETGETARQERREHDESR